MKTKKNITPLPWKYCECGCHGFEMEIGKLYFWCIMVFPANWGESNGWNSEGSVFHLNDGHKYGNHLGSFNSMEELNDFVRKILSNNLANLKKFL